MTNTSMLIQHQLNFFIQNEQTPTIFQNVMLIANPIKKIQAQKEIVQQLAKVPNIYIFLIVHYQLQNNLLMFKIQKIKLCPKLYNKSYLNFFFNG
jgi:hypothetical protein